MCPQEYSYTPNQVQFLCLSLVVSNVWEWKTHNRAIDLADKGSRKQWDELLNEMSENVKALELGNDKSEDLL